MWDGKKSTARKVVYDAFDIIKEKTKTENPVELFETAIRNVGPAMEIRSRRVGGANYQVPREVRPERKQALGVSLDTQRRRGAKGKPMARKARHRAHCRIQQRGSCNKKARRHLRWPRPTKPLPTSLGKLKLEKKTAPL